MAAAIAVCLVVASGFSFSSCFLIFDFFSVFFNATSSCVFGPLDELDSPLFGLALLMARLKPLPDSVSLKLLWFGFVETSLPGLQSTPAPPAVAVLHQNRFPPNFGRTDLLQFLAWLC